MQSITHAWRNLIGRSARLSASIGRAGAVAIITAVAAPALVTIVGFACDYGYASYINQRLARATDSGTLGSISQTAATTAGGYTQTAAMQTIGVNIFNANIADLSSTGVSFNLSVVADGTGGVIATGTYSYNVPIFFGGLLGLKNIPVSGTAKTTARPVVYANFYILVDNSQSMGIAATASDMTNLYNRVLANKNASTTDGGCVFACHVRGRVNNSQDGSGLQAFTNEDLAHNLTRNWGAPITLRIDSAVSAVNGIVTSAAQIAATTKNIQFGLYTIGIDPNTGLRVTPIKDPPPAPGKTSTDFTVSSDYASVQRAASQISLGNTVSQQNRGDTDFTNEFTDFINAFKPTNPPKPAATATAALVQGNGASATSPLNYIFLVTDGLDDVVGSGCGNNFAVCTSPIEASDCDKLKSVATLGVIYTTYLPIYQFNTAPNLEARYKALVDGDPPQIQTNLQACATSSDWYFEAQDGPSIVTAMQTLFQRTQPSSARITQ